MQALEGDIDTGHTVFLHLGSVDAAEVPDGTWAKYALGKRTPRYEVIDTEFGVMYGAARPAEDDSEYWRIANFLFPFYAMVPTGVLGLEVRVRAWVPMDDGHTLAMTIGLGQPSPPRTAGHQVVGPPETLPNTTDWYGRFRCVADAKNDYLVDRKSQKTTSYTGIHSIFLQDQAVTESMGPIYKRDQEHLGTSDAMVIRTRRRVIAAARALAEDGVMPPGVESPEMYRRRSGGIIVPREVDAMAVTRDREQKGILVSPTV